MSQFGQIFYVSPRPTKNVFVCGKIVKVRIAVNGSDCDTLPDVGVVAVLVSDVGHDLDSAVGERDAVFTLGLVAIPHLVVREVVAGVVVFHAVSEGVVARGLKWVGLFSGWRVCCVGNSLQF